MTTCLSQSTVICSIPLLQSGLLLHTMQMRIQVIFLATASECCQALKNQSAEFGLDTDCADKSLKHCVMMKYENS